MPPPPSISSTFSNNNSARTLVDSEKNKIEASLRGLSSVSSTQAEPHLKALLHFVEGDPWVCNAIVKQTTAITQLYQLLEGTGPSVMMQGSSATAAATALEILGILAMRTQSSRVVAPFCRLDGMRILVRQLNFYDPATDVALATFLEQMFCGSESDPARTVAASLGLVQKIVDRMTSVEAPPMSVSAFARVFIVAAQWHIPRKQAEAHYAIDSFFRILDNSIGALMNERENGNNNNDNDNSNMLTEQNEDGTGNTCNNHTSSSSNSEQQLHQHLAPAVLLVLSNAEEETPIAQSLSHVLRCLVVLVSNNQDNAATACSEKSLSILARLIAVVAKETMPTRLIATLLWFIYSIAATSPKLEESMRNVVYYGCDMSGLFVVQQQQQQQQNQNNMRPPSASNNNTNSNFGSNNSTDFSVDNNSNNVMAMVNPNNNNVNSILSNTWSTYLSSFRQLAATISIHLETIRREHLRSEIVAQTLRELGSFVGIHNNNNINSNNNSNPIPRVNSASGLTTSRRNIHSANNNNSNSSISTPSVVRALSRFVIGSPFIVKYLLVPLQNVDEEIVIRSCQLLNFAIESNPPAARSFLFLGGVLTLKDILNDYNPQVLYNALLLAQNLSQDAWVLRELVEREIISRILHMMVEELDSKSFTENVVSIFESRSQQAQCVANSAAVTGSTTQTATSSVSMIANTTSVGFVSKEMFATTLLQTALIFFKSNHMTSDICVSLLHQGGKTFGGYLWEPIAKWIGNSCDILTSSSSSSPERGNDENNNSEVDEDQNNVALTSSLFPVVLDTASALIRSAMFLFQPQQQQQNGNNSSNAATSINSTSLPPMSSTKFDKLFPPIEVKIHKVVEVASNVCSHFIARISPTTSANNNNNNNLSASNQPNQQHHRQSSINYTTNSKFHFSVDSPQVVSSLYFLASCCAVDPTSEGVCQLKLIKQDRCIDAVAGFLSGPAGHGRVAAWTFLAAVSSRIPEAQQTLASNSLVVSGMENIIRSSIFSYSPINESNQNNNTNNNNNASNTVTPTTATSSSRNNSARGVGGAGHESGRSSSTSSLDRAPTIPRPSGRPRSAAAPFSQSMSLLRRVLECADHIFQAKSKEYGYDFALDVAKILAHPNSSMDVRSAALDVLQAMFVSVVPASSRLASVIAKTGGPAGTSEVLDSSSTSESNQIPRIVPYLVQLLLLCEETEDAEAVTMVANRSFKLMTSLPAKQTMSTLFNIACDALDKMNITSISTLNSPFRRSSRGATSTPLPSSSFSSSAAAVWPWSPIPAPADADEAHDLLVGILPLINGLLYHEMSFCEILFSDANAWSFFFILADAEELQLGLRVLALMAFGNMMSKVRNPEKISVFFEKKELQVQFTRAISKLLQLPSSLDEIENYQRNQGDNGKRNTSPTIISTVGELVKVRKSCRNNNNNNTMRDENADSLFLPDEALETLIFILDRVSMFAKKLQSPSFVVPLANNNNNNDNDEFEKEMNVNRSILLDNLLCSCFVTWNDSICQFARSLLYYVFQNDGICDLLANASQKSRLKLVLTAIVDEMNLSGDASATDSRRQAEAILMNMK